MQHVYKQLSDDTYPCITVKFIHQIPLKTRTRINRYFVIVELIKHCLKFGRITHTVLDPF